nr:ribonuclease H-like domain-containing protein [Tanacetum cinerariifolium]
MATGVIVDSGDNQHLTYTNKLLVNVIDISKLGIKVPHPNGTEAVITKVGKEGCASWDGGKGTWGGRAKVFGIVPVCVRVQESEYGGRGLLAEKTV